MESPTPQESCDWCYGPLSEKSVVRSRWLGLIAEDAWACATCVKKGRYRVPPEGWAGPAEDWLARDEYILSAGDRMAVLHALNEVLNGPEAIEEWEFQSRMGVTREQADQTWRRIAGD